VATLAARTAQLHQARQALTDAIADTDTLLDMLKAVVLRPPGDAWVPLLSSLGTGIYCIPYTISPTR
jgi:hypothetical protein